MSPNKVRFQLFLEPEQVAALRRIQERTGTAVAEQIRRAINWWLEQENREPPTRRQVRTRRK